MALEQLRDTQLERLRATLRNAVDNVPFYRRRLADAGVAPDDLTTRERVAALPFTTKADLRDHYPFGMFARAPRPAGAGARLVGHHGQPDHRGLHVRRRRAVGRPHRAHAGGGRHRARRHVAERLRLRPVHRRPGPALWLRAPRRHRAAHLRRQHRPPAQAHARLRRDGPVVHAVVRPLPGRSGPRPRLAPRRPAHQGRLSRRRAVEQRDAPPDRGRAGHRRARHLRPLRDGRAGRGLRVPLQDGHARERRPLPGRDRRSPRPCRRCPRARWASSS